MGTQPTKYYSTKQESMIAADLGWAVVAGSGAAPCTPGDIISDDWLGECKTHEDKHKIFFDYAVWGKIKEEAMMKHRKPVLFVDDGSQRLDRTWCVCSAATFNLTSLVIVPLYVSIRKNITFSHGTAHEHLRKEGKKILTDFFDDILFTANWHGEEVLVMKLSTFKENCDK